MIIACDKIPIFNKICDNLYLGDIVAAENIELLKENNIESVICLVKENYKRYDLRYYDFPIDDNRNENIYDMFEKTNKIISENKNVFVHCQNAVSRSVTIVLAYLLYTGINLKDALSKLKENRKTFTRPNFGFARQLLRYEYSLFDKNSITLEEILKI